MYRNNLGKCSLLILITVLIAHTQIALSQTNKQQEKVIRTTASSFFRKYLKHPDFNYKGSGNLYPFFSSRLNVLIGDYYYRLNEFQKEDPPKYPLIRYSLTCNPNVNDPPKHFHISRITRHNKIFLARVTFDYYGGIDKIDRCAITAIFIRIKEKWLFDNAKFDDGGNLKKSLRIKFSKPLPE